MATGSVSTGSIYNELQQYFQTRSSDQQAPGCRLGAHSTATPGLPLLQEPSSTGPPATSHVCKPGQLGGKISPGLP
jgi:hypothetical protein